MKKIADYMNGNVHFKLYEDGTLIREFNDKQPVIVNSPSSIDVKITNHCSGKVTCRKFCHEKSNPRGQHGDLDKLSYILKDLPAGTEIAVGGGNPLSHPQLISFLQRNKDQGLITNITINQQHINSYKNLIFQLINEKLIYGIGISYSSRTSIDDVIPILNVTNNVVFHVIMGINDVREVCELKKTCTSINKICKILVLGYKQYGMGINYYLKNKTIEDNKYQWYTQLAKHFKEENLILSFDNLAIEQLKLKRYFTEKAWNRFYMGDDFHYTMYIDGVNQEYAPTSTSKNRKSFKNYSLLEYFNKYRNY